VSDSPWSDADGPTLPDGEPTLVGGPPGPVAPDAPTWPTSPPTAPPTHSSPVTAAPAATWPGAGVPPPPLAPSPPAGAARRRRPAGARTVIGIVLLFVAGLSAVGTFAAAFARSQIRSEDTWAATADALADDPQVRQAVADLIAAEVISVTGADDLISGVLPGPLGALSGPLTDRATELVSTATEQLVGTDAFRAAWRAAVRSSHAELLAALDGDGRVTEITSQGVVLDLGSTLEQLRLLLDDKGLTFLDGIDLSGVDLQVPLIDAPGVQTIADVLDALDVLVIVLPIVAAVAAVSGLLVARRRSWAVIGGGVGAVVGAAVIWAAVGSGRDQAVDQVSGGVLGPGVVRVVADEVVASLRGPLALAAVLGGVVVVAGSVAAVATSRRA
jgi:hypothetical protein